MFCFFFCKEIEGGGGEKIKKKRGKEERSRRRRKRKDQKREKRRRRYKMVKRETDRKTGRQAPKNKAHIFEALAYLRSWTHF